MKNSLSPSGLRRLARGHRLCSDAATTDAGGAPSDDRFFRRPLPCPPRQAPPRRQSCRGGERTDRCCCPIIGRCDRSASRSSWAICRSTWRCIRAGASRRSCTAVTARTKSWWWTFPQPKSSRAPAFAKPFMGWNSRRMAGRSFAAGREMRWCMRLSSSEGSLTNHQPDQAARPHAARGAGRAGGGCGRDAACSPPMSGRIMSRGWICRAG